MDKTIMPLNIDQHCSGYDLANILLIMNITQRTANMVIVVW